MQERMEKLKVYILLEFFRNIDAEGCNVIGVYRNKNKAEKELGEIIEDNIKNFDYVEDNQNNNMESKTLYFNQQNNYENYIEYTITEKKIL